MILNLDFDLLSSQEFWFWYWIRTIFQEFLSWFWCWLCHGIFKNFDFDIEYSNTFSIKLILVLKFCTHFKNLDIDIDSAIDISKNLILILNSSKFFQEFWYWFWIFFASFNNLDFDIDILKEFQDSWSWYWSQKAILAHLWPEKGGIGHRRFDGHLFLWGEVCLYLENGRRLIIDFTKFFVK